MKTLPKLFIAIISIIIAIVIITVNFEITPMQIVYIMVFDLIIAIIATIYSSSNFGYASEIKITTFLFYFGIMITLSIIALWRTEGIVGQHLLLTIIVFGVFLKWLLSSDKKLET